MRMKPAAAAALTALAMILCWVQTPAAAQEVISARSGAVHFIEGAASIDGQTLDRKSGAFPVVKEGSVLRTARGRAEVLLMPGAFLRIDENSAIRMISSQLSDTQVEFLGGSAIVDLAEAPAGSAFRVTDKDARIEFPKPGVYRLDSDTGVLQVYSGEALVTANGQKAHVDSSHLFFFSLGLETNKLGATEDEFYDWARDRNQTISDENQLAEQTKGDPGDVDDTIAGTPYSSAPGTGLGGGQNVPLPNFSSPAVPYPSLPGFGSYGAFGTYGYSQYLNPSFAFAPAPYLLTGFPQILLVPYRPRFHNNPNWPHTSSPVWRPVSSGSLSVIPRLPSFPAHPLISPLSSYRPVTVPRPSSVNVRPPVTAVHPSFHK